MKGRRNCWQIRKRNNSWQVLYDTKLLVSFDSWEEARALVSYTARTAPIAQHRALHKRGRRVTLLLLTQFLDYVLLVLGIAGVVLTVILEHWYFFPIPLVFVLLAFRGFVLYRHLDLR